MKTQGNLISVKADVVSSIDPRVTSVDAKKGTLYRFIPDIGDAVLLIKQDDGDTTNWGSIGGGSSYYIEGSVNPLDPPGVPAALGTIYSDIVNSGLFQKTGPGDQDWRQFDKTVADRYIILTSTDPTTGPGLAASVGTLAIKTSVPAGLYFKVSIPNLAWAKIGYSLTGLPNTMTYFNTAGAVGTNPAFEVNEANRSIFIKSTDGLPASVVTGAGFGSFAHGNVSGEGAIIVDSEGSGASGSVWGNNGANLARIYVDASARGARSFGFVDATSGVDSQISSYADGAFAFGSATSGVIQAAGGGASSHGQTVGANSRIEANASGSEASGYATAGGRIIVSDFAGRAFGRALTGKIEASQSGAFAYGYATGHVNALISATAIGSNAYGYVLSESGIFANGQGSTASGYASSPGGGIVTNGIGSFAKGVTNDANSIIQANSSASYAMGVVSNGSVISAESLGAFAMGQANGGGEIRSQAEGSCARGAAFGLNAKIRASDTGSTATGVALSGGEIRTTGGGGSLAMGQASGAQILAFGFGCVAIGQTTPGKNISSQGSASFAGGFADTGRILINGNGSFAWGGDIDITSDYSAAFGIGHDLTASGQFFVGKYAGGNGGLNQFVVGNGTGVGFPENSFETRFDNTHKFGGAEVLKIFRVTGNLTISTYFPFVFWTIASPVTIITLPANPEDGEMYKFKNMSPTAQTISGNGRNIVIPPGGAVPSTNLATGGYLELFYSSIDNLWYSLAQA